MAARIREQVSEPESSVRGLPATLEVGTGTALRLDGSIDASLLPLRAIRVVVGEHEREVDGFGLARSKAEGETILWWAVVPVSASIAQGAAEVRLIADRATGDSVEIALGEVQLEVGARPATAATATDGSAPLIAVCMATYEPSEEWLRRQLDSIRAQTWSRWICVISDDASSPEAFAVLERAVGDDSRFVVSRSGDRLGFYDNFQRAIRMAPPEAGLIAPCDQDDRWDPDKLEALSATLAGSPGAALAYSDMRIADEHGRILSDTFWYLRRNRYDDIASVLIANTVTGAASMFRRELLDVALPFPPGGTPEHYHDQWLALCALALGEIAYLDRPTYDYTRHLDSVTIAAAAEFYVPPNGLRERAALRWRRLSRRLRMAIDGPNWRELYLERILMIRQLVAVLELRAGERVSPAKRRSLGLLTAADRSPRAAAWLAARVLRPLVRRNETMARERVLVGSLIWRAIVVRRARQGSISPRRIA